MLSSKCFDKKRFGLVVCLVFSGLFLSCQTQEGAVSEANGQEAGADVEKRLADMGITLVSPEPPTANFVRAVRTGNLVFMAGHGPRKPDGGLITGKVGRDLDLEQAKEAAKYTGISILSSLKAAIGDLNKVKRVVKVHGMVNAMPDFTQHSQVMNGFSDFIVEVFGPRGKHARAAVGMGSLPRNMAVEIEVIFEVED